MRRPGEGVEDLPQDQRHPEEHHQQEVPGPGPGAGNHPQGLEVEDGQGRQAEARRQGDAGGEEAEEEHLDHHRQGRHRPQVLPEDGALEAAGDAGGHEARGQGVAGGPGGEVLEAGPEAEGADGVGRGLGPGAAGDLGIHREGGAGGAPTDEGVRALDVGIGELEEAQEALHREVAGDEVHHLEALGGGVGGGGSDGAPGDLAARDREDHRDRGGVGGGGGARFQDREAAEAPAQAHRVDEPEEHEDERDPLHEVPVPSVWMAPAARASRRDAASSAPPAPWKLAWMRRAAAR